MRTIGNLAPIVGGFLLILTYLLVQGASPDAVRHERTLDALRLLILNDAALQRDVLKARSGLLRNYDPLVQSVDNLHRATADLRTVGQVNDGEEGAEIERSLERVKAAVRDEETLVEIFKAKNALLQNSLMYFSHASHQLGPTGGDGGNVAADALRELDNAMLRFMTDARDSVAGEVATLLDRLAQLAAGQDPQQDLSILLSHGRLIVATLPEVDDLVSRLQSAPTSERARTLQDAYLDAHGRAAARAGLFRALLYVASIALVAYVAYLFVRLRANAQVLRERLAFEQLIAAISTQFINLPRERIDDGVNDGLARLAEHADVDRAHIIVADDRGDRVRREYLWRRAAVRTRDGRPDEVLSLARRWTLGKYERRGCINVPCADALPESPEKNGLALIGARSWLCAPMWRGGKRVGFLALDSVATERRWLDDDIALIRTAGEIFANAIERERDDSEREALEARLRQAQRLEAIGTLAGGIAHEFNNILGAILGYAERALARVGKDSVVRADLKQVMSAGRRAQAVVDQVLTFGRRSERRYQPMRVQPEVAEVVELLRASLPPTLTLRARLEADDAAMLSHPTELQQVVTNLCTNAAHAAGGRGAVEVGLDTVKIAGDVTLSHGALAAGDYIRLTVTDTGPGIDATVMERMFEPFFTTKPAGQGTGLGLPTVYGVVKQHGGALDVQSWPGAGAMFQAYFPRTGEPAIDEAPRAAEASTQGDGETILLVDDEKPLVLLAEEMLAALGYEPVGFDQSAAALAAFRDDPHRFDLVLTDQVMPGMTGLELAAELHEVRPELPIILMTGHGGALQTHRLQSAGVHEVLKKPLLATATSLCLARHLPARNEARQARRM